MKDPELKQYDLCEWERSLLVAAGNTDEEIEQLINERSERIQEQVRKAQAEAEEEQEFFLENGGIIDGVRTPEIVGTERQRAAFREREPLYTEREIDAHFYQDYRARTIDSAGGNNRNWYLAGDEDNAQNNDQVENEEYLNILDNIVFDINNEDDEFINVVD